MYSFNIVFCDGDNSTYFSLNLSSNIRYAKIRVPLSISAYSCNTLSLTSDLFTTLREIYSNKVTLFSTTSEGSINSVELWASIKLYAAAYCE